MELWFGLYLFSLVFLLFPFLLSCLSCDGFCRIPFRLRFFLLISSYLFLFFLMLHVHFCQASASPLWFLSACKLYSLSSFLHLFAFSSGGSLFRLVLRSGTKPKRREKRRQNSRQADWHGPSQELASLLPHPATTATTATATAGPSYASAAGFCLTTTSKAPTPPPTLRWLLVAPLLPLLLQLSLPLPLLVLRMCWRLCCCRCCHCCNCCRCCPPLLLPLLLLLLFLLLALHLLLLLAPLLLLRIRVLILAYPGTVFATFAIVAATSSQWWLRDTARIFAKPL